MRFDVVGFGAMNLDRLYRVDDIAGRGEQRLISSSIDAPGGSAANAAVGLARLRHKVGFIGKVGNDREGKYLLESLRAERVNVKGVAVSRTVRSGAVLGFVDAGGERTMYIDPGANDTLSSEDVSKGYADGAKFLHMTSFIGEKPFEAQKKLVQNISDVKLSFDPGDIYARRGITSLRPLLRRSFVVFPNEAELKLLTSKGYEDGSKALISEGTSIVVVKLGDRGCYISDGREKMLVEAFKQKALDTTGAGDAFCAGFLHGLLQGKDLYTCGRLGNFVAARKIEKLGAREGLPRLEELPNI